VSYPDDDEELLKVRLFHLFYPLPNPAVGSCSYFFALVGMLAFVDGCTCDGTDRPWEDDVIYENTMDFDWHDNEGIFIDAGPQL
jgi:hypothetical protein